MQQTPEQRRKNAARRSRRTLSVLQVAALREIGSHSKSQHYRDVKLATGNLQHLNIRMTLSALARKGLITFDGEYARIAPAGTALLIRNVR